MSQFRASAIARFIASFRPRPRRAETRVRPRTLVLEKLEDRCLLTTFTVTNTNDTGGGSLRSAIDKANTEGGEDKIVFESSVLGKTIQIGSSLPALTDDVIIQAKKSGVAVDGQDIAGVRPFEISAGATVTLKKLTITGGNLTINGDFGGGILNEGTLKLQKCTVTGNHSTFGSGGILTRSGSVLTVAKSSVSNNSSGIHGGGIFVSSSQATITKSNIFGNRANSSGGGIRVIATDNESAALTVSDSTIAGNYAQSNGGGIITTDSGTSLGVTLLIERSTISGNLSRASGGGLFNDAPGTFTIENSTFAHNLADSAALGGGAFHSSDGTFDILNATIARNSASNSGGGIRQTGGTINLNNSILSENFANSNDERETTAGTFNNDSSLEGGSPQLGPLQNNGGPTQTMLPLSGSPVIDAGSDALANTAGLTTDQRGNGFDRIVGTVDQGATERQSGEPLPLQESTTRRERRRGERNNSPSVVSNSFEPDLAFAAAVMNQDRAITQHQTALQAAFAEFGAL